MGSFFVVVLTMCEPAQLKSSAEEKSKCAGLAHEIGYYCHTHICTQSG
jgi:hypothetical protein